MVLMFFFKMTSFNFNCHPMFANDLQVIVIPRKLLNDTPQTLSSLGGLGMTLN
jgi:hypothetical protein